MTKDELFSHIKKTICDGESISQDVVFMKTRKKEILFARQLIMFFAYDNNIGSQTEVGKLCGGKDHATVIHAIKVINNYVDTDRHKKELITYYKLKLKGYIPQYQKTLKDHQIADLKEENTELKKRIKLLEGEVYRLQCRLNNHRVKQGESVQPYHGYVEHF